MSVNWLFLVAGGLCESLFAMSLGKMQQHVGRGFWIWFLVFAISVSLSMTLLFKAMGKPHPIPTGTAYAVWAGIGAVGSVVLGIVVFKEAVTFWRMFFLTILILSIVGLELTGGK